MLAAATQYALGNSWGPFNLPEVDTDRRVLVLYGEEDQKDVHHRLHSLQHTFMLTDEQIEQVSARMAVLPLRGQNISLAEYEPHERNVQITEAMTRLEARITQYNVQLMVLDPMALLHGLDENDNHAIGEFVRQLDAMCLRTGCSVVLIHHFSKAIARAREVNESNVRGASSLVNHVRSVVVMHRLRRDESAEWGVPEEDHSRWVMLNVVKNNYGHSGVVTWFNVNPSNGVVSPSETQLTFMNSRDIRTAVLAAQHQDAQEQEDDLTEAEERQARVEAERQIQILRFMELILREAVNHYQGALPSLQVCREIVLSEDAAATASHSRIAVSQIKDRGLVSERGRNFVISEAGQQWLEEREILS
jgi:RecA-family ATPase